MADVADLRVIRDSEFTLSTAGASAADRDMTFNLGTEVQHGQRGILQFRYRADPVHALTARVRINGTAMKPLRFGDGASEGTMHEVVNTNVTRDNTNDIEFGITGGSGSLAISDVVLHVQRTA